MKLFVRPAELPRERQLLTTLLRRNLPDIDHDLRFEWAYEKNPAGRGRAWFVCDGTGENVIGTASVFPRLVWIYGRLSVCAQVGDFAVDAAHRSLGPALMLQKATLSAVDEGDFTFCYDCPPHDRGMATFKRLGLTPVCRMARHARLLEADAALQKRMPGSGWIRAPLTAVANLALRLAGGAARLPKGAELETRRGPFGDEFSAFDERMATSEPGTVRMSRSADVLNWRFANHPVLEYRVLTLRRSGDLLGFAVCRGGKERARLLDIAASSDEAHASLLRAAAEVARQEGALTIDMLVVGTSPDAALAKASGYVFRGHAERVVVYAAETHRESLVASERWILSASDIMA